MGKPQDPITEDKVDLLKHMELIQRAELNQRREREYKIFTWSSNILLALIGALLIARQSQGIVWLQYGFWGKVTASITVVLLVIFSVQWQNKNRRWHIENGGTIQRIDYLLHYYEKGHFDPEGEVTIFLERWREGYSMEDLRIVKRLTSVNYVSATAILGFLAIVMIWVPQ
jgi:ABC-type transport system involved in Fe-S cluster assembly fused permease/ATPase subunit